MTIPFFIFFALTYNYSNDEIIGNSNLQSLTRIAIFLSIPFLFLLTYCNNRLLKKKPLNGFLLNELIISEQNIQIKDQIFEGNDISKLEITIKGYRKYSTHGADNQITIQNSPDFTTILFELQSKSHYQKLLAVISDLRKQGMNIILVDEIANN